MTQHKPPKILHKKHLARAQREALLQRWVIVVSLGILVLIAAVVGYGYFDQNVLQPAQPVAKVGATEITVEQFQKAVKYQRYVLIQNYFQTQQIAAMFGNDDYYQSQLEQLAFQLDNSPAIGRQVLSSVIDDEIVRQEAAKQGITIPAAEVDKSLQEAFGYYANGTLTPVPTLTLGPTATATHTPTLAPNVTPTTIPTVAPTLTLAPTPTVTPGPSPTPFPTATPITLGGYQKLLGDFVTPLSRRTSMTEADLRRLVETNLLRDKLRDAIAKNTPRDVVEANSRHILVADEKTAKDLIERIKKGEDFAKLAAEFSTDVSNKDQGGALGVQPKGFFVPEFDAVVFAAPVGLYPDPVKTTFGYHLIEVLARNTRAMTDEEFDGEKAKVFSTWLTTQRSNTGLVTEYDRWKTNIPKTPTLLSIQQEEATQAVQTATVYALTVTPTPKK